MANSAGLDLNENLTRTGYGFRDLFNGQRFSEFFQ